MNPSFSDDDLDALFALARGLRPDTSRAEHAFETRLMARLRGEQARPSLGRLAWRMMPFFAAIVLFLAFWQVHSAADAGEAAQAAYLENALPGDVGGSLN